MGAPASVQNTTDVLFRDLLAAFRIWRLSIGSLVTVSALVATGQVAQIP